MLTCERDAFLAALEADRTRRRACPGGGGESRRAPADAADGDGAAKASGP